MNTQRVMLLSLGILISSKFGSAAVQLPNLVGLRCEFNGNIEFSLPQKFFEDYSQLENELRIKNPESFYDASRICDIKIGTYMNGSGLRCKCKLKPSQWIWLTKNASVRITLKPKKQKMVYPHRDVYFYNVFNKPLSFSLSKVEFEQFKNLIFIKSGQRETTLANFEHQYDVDGTNKCFFTLAPGMSIRYSVELGLNLTLES